MKRQNRLAIFARAFNRTATFETFTKAMSVAYERCPDADLWFLFDGARNPVSKRKYGEDTDISATRKVLLDSPLAKLADLRTIYLGENLGCAAHKYIQLTTLFDRHAYDYAILIDNDYQVAPCYIERALQLFKQFDGDPNTGMLQMSPRITDSYTKELAEKNAGRVTRGFGPRGEIGLWATTWDKIRKDYTRYYKVVSGLDFRQVITEKGTAFKSLVNVYGTAHADHLIELLVQKHRLHGILTKARHYKIMQQKGWYSGKGGKYYKPEYTNLKLYDLPNVKEYILE